MRICTVNEIKGGRVKKFFSIIIILLLLVFGLWASATYWFGLKAETQYRNFLQQASSGQALLKLENASYQRGLFESKARTLVEITGSAGPDGVSRPIRLTLDHDITHGPFSFSRPVHGKVPFTPLMAIIESKLVPGGEDQSQLAEFTTRVPELASARDYTVVNLDGSGQEHLTIPGFQRTLGNKDQTAVACKGLSLQIDFTGDLKGIRGSLHVPGLEIVEKDIRLNIHEVEAAFDSGEGAAGLALGDASFDMASFEMTSKRDSYPATFLIEALGVRTSSRASGDVIKLSVAVKAGRLRIGEDPCGPAIFEMELRNLDAPSLAKLQRLVRERQTHHPARTSRDATQLAMITAFGDILPGLLSKSPELEVRQLDIKTALGDFSGMARISFNGSQLDSGFNLLVAAKALAAEAEFKAGERLLHDILWKLMKEKIIGQRRTLQGPAPNDEETSAIASAHADEQIEALRAQNLLVKDDGRYGVRATYKAGELVLNGRPLSLLDLLQ
jgi:uncharacterized protein YdgA (DUF945 family)